MNYPYSLLDQAVSVGSIFGTKDMGEPCIFDYSDANPLLWGLDMNDQSDLQSSIDQTLLESENNWGMAGYLERRKSLLREFPQMVKEERFFHLGVDIFLPPNFQIHSPLDGVLVQSGYEEGRGNFGGYALIQHDIGVEPFYSLWGHLDSESVIDLDSIIKRGDVFGRTGEMDQNGNWFYHTHLQVLTQKGLDEGYLSKGYCTTEMLPSIDQYCPSPLFLLRY